MVVGDGVDRDLLKYAVGLRDADVVHETCRAGNGADGAEAFDILRQQHADALEPRNQRGLGQRKLCIIAHLFLQLSANVQNVGEQLRLQIPPDAAIGVYSVVDAVAADARE